MKIKAKIQKWGNGLGLRVSGPIRDIPRFVENSVIELEINEHGFIATKIEDTNELRTLPFTETELLQGMTPQTAHADLVINRPLNGEF